MIGFGAEFPTAVAEVIDDIEELLAFYDRPAEHRIHLRTYLVRWPQLIYAYQTGLVRPQQ